MFAVFNKNQFMNWWMNSPSDKNWLDLTIRGMGWNPADVDVLWFDYPRSPQTIYSFDEDKKLLIHQKETLESGQEVMTVTETWEGRVFMAKGKYAKNF